MKEKDCSRRNFLKMAGVAGGAVLVGLGPVNRVFAAKQQLRTIGLGVTVQDQILQEFTKRTGIPASGTAATMADSMTKMLTGGVREWDSHELITSRIEPLKHTLRPIPVKALKYWNEAAGIFAGPIPSVQKAQTQLSDLIYTDSKRTHLWMAPIVGNFDTIGYLPEFVDAPNNRLSYGAIFEPKYKGRAAFNTDVLVGMELVAMYLRKIGKLPKDVNVGDLGKKEVDITVNFLIQKKKEGQFRVLWNDFGSLVDLMASKEVWVADAWQPVVMAVEKQGTPCRYAEAEEGSRAWFIGVGISKGTPNYEACIEYINFWHEGFPSQFVASQGYYVPCLKRAKKYIGDELHGFFYEGKPDSKGKYRDGGSYEQRTSNVGANEQWPREYLYHIKRWDDFLAA